MSAKPLATGASKLSVKTTPATAEMLERRKPATAAEAMDRGVKIFERIMLMRFPDWWNASFRMVAIETGRFSGSEKRNWMKPSGSWPVQLWYMGFHRLGPTLLLHPFH
jgi:hypothetical protein